MPRVVAAMVVAEHHLLEIFRSYLRASKTTLQGKSFQRFEGALAVGYCHPQKDPIEHC